MKRRTFYLSLLTLFLLMGGGVGLWYEFQKSRENENHAERYFAASRNSDTESQPKRWSVEEDEPIAEEELVVDPVVVAETKPFVELPEELTIFDRTVLEKRKLQKLSWKPGLSWKVESYYLRMDRPGEPSWTEKPIVWEFEVLGTEKLGEEEVYVVEIYPEDLTGMPYNPGGKVYISTKTNSVVALKDRVLEAGVVKDRFLSFSDPGSGVLSTLLPLELPPTTAKGNTVHELGSFGLGTPGPALPKGTEKPSTGTDMMEVAFKSNGVTVLQRWDATKPVWPVYSSTPYRVSYLRKGS